MKNLALYTSAVVFALISALHVWRYTSEVEIVAGTTTIPVWVSLLVALLFALLAVWMVVAARR